MRESIVRRRVVATAAAALTLGLLPAIAAAEPAVPDASDRPAAVAQDVARGLVVKTTATDATLQRAVDRAGGAELDATTPEAITGQISLVDFGDVVPGEDAAEVAEELSARRDVEWAIPNRPVKPAAASPVTPNDPYFSRQHQLWDASRAAGGFSTKAPAAWPATLGTGTVVAVLDTGVVTSHPDLRNRVVPGYDLIDRNPDLATGSALPRGHRHEYYVANDGDGRDANATDPGDWIPEGDSYCFGAPTGLVESSWHGTHVAGIVAAHRNNRTGVAGIAPDARVQPVRVLGRCLGWDSDVLAGIEWASGGSVAGVPDNKTPADVINLSLGAYYEGAPALDLARACEAYGDVMGRALARGAVTVAAAGNEAGDADLSVPAACPNAVSVAATDLAGTAASYTNTGGSVDVSAPGGDADAGGASGAILSTVDVGATRPAGAGYGRMMGTSMAAPAVSAAAALLMAEGVRAEDVETALRSIAQPFGPATASSGPACGPGACGAGIIDLSRAPLPVSGPAIDGAPIVGQRLQASPGRWVSGTDGLAYQWTRDGADVLGATDATYTLTEADRGTAVAVRVAPTLPGFAGVRSASAPTRTIGVDVGLTSPTSSTYGRASTHTVTAVDENGPLTGRAVELRNGTRVVARGTIGADGTARLVAPGTSLAAGRRTLVAVVPATTGDAGSWSSPRRYQSVAKATAGVGQSISSTVRSTSRPRLVVTVKVSGVTHPTGRLRVYDGRRHIATVHLSSTGRGQRTITLPRLKRGKHAIKTVYAGNANIKGRTSATRTVTSR